ncbi:GNAT family N-acetyltransferase [soil metagenome]
MEIRPARPEEFAEAGRVTEEAYEAEGFLVASDGSYDHDYAAWLRDGAARAALATLVVAADDDSLLGTVMWCPLGSPFRELAKEPEQAEFRTLAVSVATRGRGVGRALVSYCIDRARAEGHTTVVISSLPSMKNAHRLYESLGFDRRPDLDWSPKPGVALWGFSYTL